MPAHGFAAGQNGEIRPAMVRGLVLWAWLALAALAAPPPELPGQEITEAEEALARSRVLTRPADSLPVRARQENSSWQAPSIQDQLARDKTLIGLGYGALFAPCFTEPQLEPEITVFEKDGRLAATGLPGQRLLLEKGRYEVRLGSGNLTTKQRYFATITEGATTVLQPDWAGLAVETIDERGENLRAEYEVFRLGSSEPVGKGYGLEERRLKDTRTWILRPGVYRLAKPGQDFRAFKNYITVELKAGELTVVELVFDTPLDGTRVTIGDLIAGGVRDVALSRRGRGNWRWGLRLGGNASYNLQTAGDSTEVSTLNALGDLRLRLIYDRASWLGTSLVQASSSFERKKGDIWSPLTDGLEIRTTWVRRLNRYIGPYVSANLNAHLWPVEKHLAGGESAWLLGPAGDTLKPLSSPFEVQPRLYPVIFREGLGASFQFPLAYFLDLGMQVGAAARQERVGPEQLVQDAGRTGIYRYAQDLDEYGLENTWEARASLGARVNVDFSAELFYPNLRPSEYRLDRLLVDARISLTRHLDLSYIFLIHDRKSLNQTPRFLLDHTFLLRVSVNM